MYDIIIIGAGPAGLTAALYGKRAGKKILLLEKKAYGGQIIETPRIENYPGIINISGFDFATNLYNQVKNLDCEIKYENVEEITTDGIVKTKKGCYKAKKIIIAAGLEKRRLNIDHEEEFLGRGVSYCATCDGAFYKDLEVAIVGGGNTALEDALYLSNICKKVYLIHRRDKFRGEEKYQKEITSRKNIELILNSTITKLFGREHLDKIEINKDNQKEELKISALFIAIGQVPNTNNFKSIIETDEEGFIKSVDGVHTSCKNIYVAGDIRKKDVRQLTTAVADGANAVTICIKEMEK